MKFQDMPYSRPDKEQLIEGMKKTINAFCNAQNYQEAKELFLQWEDSSKHTETMATLVSIRHSIDTRDPFYDQ